MSGPLVPDGGRGELDSAEPEGIISHIAGPTASGWRVVDVWESEDQAGQKLRLTSFEWPSGATPPPGHSRRDYLPAVASISAKATS